MLDVKQGDKVLFYQNGRAQGLLTVTRVTKTMCAAVNVNGAEYRFRLKDGYQYGGTIYTMRRIVTNPKKIKEYEDWLSTKRDELKRELIAKVQQAPIHKLKQAIEAIK